MPIDDQVKNEFPRIVVVTYRCRPCDLTERFTTAFDIPNAYFAKQQCKQCGGLMHLESYAGGALK